MELILKLLKNLEKNSKTSINGEILDIDVGKLETLT